jgi:hypothetical protein
MAIDSRKSVNIVAALAISLAASAAASGAAQAQNRLGNIANNDGIFIDGKTFEVLGGQAKGDVAAQVKALGARELGGGAIIFRSGDKLYIVDGAAAAPMSAAAAPMSPAAAPITDKGPIHIEYQEPKNPALKPVRERVMQNRGLETYRELLSPFRMPEDLYIKAVDCDGVPNAYFFRENDVATIRICYDYLKEINDTLPKETTPAGIEPHDALLGQLMFALMHEFGHAAFDLYQIPVFGRQEDAADQFATYIMLQFGGEKAHRLIKGAAFSYKGVIKTLKDKPQVTVPMAAFSSDHGAPEQRFYNLACIAYGYDPKIFAEVVDKDYLPEHRAKVCKYEYGNLRFAFRKMIAPHIDMAKAREVIDKSFRPEGNERAPGQ